VSMKFAIVPSSEPPAEQVIEWLRRKASWARQMAANSDITESRVEELVVMGAPGAKGDVSWLQEVRRDQQSRQVAMHGVVRAHDRTYTIDVTLTVGPTDTSMPVALVDEVNTIVMSLARVCPEVCTDGTCVAKCE